MCIIVSYEAPSSLSFGTNLHCSWKRFSLTAVFKCVSQVLHTPFRLISFCEMSPEPIKFWQRPNTKNDIIETKIAARTTGNLFCCCCCSFSFDQGRVSYIHEIVFNINWLVKVMNIFVIVNLGIIMIVLRANIDFHWFSSGSVFVLVTDSRASCLHFILLFWNQTLTWLSDSPNMDASWWRSAFVKYFWTWNLFSSPLRWRLENTARVQGLLGLRGFVSPGLVWVQGCDDVGASLLYSVREPVV